MDALPPELKSQSLPVVAVYGLDTTAVSNKILWELLISSDRKTISYVNLDTENENVIPQSKPERTSYEWYIPKGILKSKWLEKHLSILPSVAVCFADLDWNDPLWPEKKTEVVEKLQRLKTIIGTRGCKIALVLIQKGPPMPPGEDPIATERAGALCQACDLPAKYLFALPCHADHLHGYTMRLEAAFLDMAQAHYLSEARRVKSHREHLNRTNHAYLFGRHAFKIAVYCDLRQDQGNALKHYLQAYENLIQIRVVDNNINEIKTVSTIIAYKIWKINFTQNQPRDAISHFKSHLDHFRTYVGPQELEFEHEAWLANQYEIFGSVFEEAIAGGLPAIQKEHPGFYYQQAASHAQGRKRLFRKSLKTGVTPSDMALLDVPLEFYGQRPWRPGKILQNKAMRLIGGYVEGYAGDMLNVGQLREYQVGIFAYHCWNDASQEVSIEPPDAEKEAEGIAYLKHIEKSSVDHSKEIVLLLNRAVEHFESQKSPGLKRQLLSQIATEHYESGNYREALAILHPLLWEFRCDGWWSLLTNLLQTGLKSAYGAALRGDYFTLGAEIVCSHSMLSAAEKAWIFENLMGILDGKAPSPEEGLVQSQSSSWESSSCVATIALNTFTSLIEMKARFPKAEYSCDADIVLEVFIKNLTSFPIGLSKVAVALSNTRYADVCQLSDPVKLQLGPEEMKRLEFRIHAEPGDVGSSITISSVSAFLGNLSSRYVLFHCEGSQSEDFSPFNPAHEFAAARQPWNKRMTIGEILPLPSTDIRPKAASVEISLVHEAPALVKELYQVKVNIKNRELSKIDALEIFFTGHPEKPTSEEESKAQNCTAQSSVTTNCTAQSSVTTIPARSCVDGTWGCLRNFTCVFITASPLADDEAPVTKEAVLTLTDLDVDESRSVDFYAKVSFAGNILLQVKVVYSVKVSKDGSTLNCSSVGSQTLSLKVIEPFKVTCEYKTLGFVPIQKLLVHEELILIGQLKMSSPHVLEIDRCEFRSSDFELQSNSKNLDGIVLEKDECATECWALRIKPETARPAEAEVAVTWKREPSALPPATTVIRLPSLPVEHSSLALTMELPARGYIRQPLCAKITLKNLSSYLCHRVQVTMDSNDAFMFAGNKLINLTVEPDNSYTLTYNLYPLLAGYVALPPFRLAPLSEENAVDTSVPWTTEKLNHMIERSLPSHIYVLPQPKKREANVSEG